MANSAPDVKTLLARAADLSQETFCDSTGADVGFLAPAFGFDVLSPVYNAEIRTDRVLLLFWSVGFGRSLYAFPNMVSAGDGKNFNLLTQRPTALGLHQVFYCYSWNNDDPRLRLGESLIQ